MVLGAIGMIWLGFGLRLFIGVDATPHIQLPLEYLPLWARGGVWIVPGLFAIVACFYHSRRATKWGFVGLVVPCTLRAFSYLGGVIIEVGNWFQGAEPMLEARMVADLLIWVGINVLIVLLATWPDLDRRDE